VEARNRTLPDWFTRIRTRQITLPRFQRFEAWTHTQVTALLSTVLQGLPAGAVLTLEVGDTEPFVSRPMVGAPQDGERVTEQLLDGQQRLTALWRSLNDDYDDRSFFVCLEPDEESGAFAYATSFSRWIRNGKRYPVWLDDPAQLWAKHLLPVHLLRPDIESAAALKEWAKVAAANDMDAVLEIVESGNRIRELFAKFNLPFLSLPSTTDQETALNVFIQMNTSASPLSAYDIVVAQVESSSGASLHELADDIRADVPTLAAYIEPASLVLAISALLQESAPIKSTFLSKGFSTQLLENWELAKRGIQRAVAFLEDEKIFDNKRLPTEVILGPLSALWALAPQGLDAAGEARTLLRKYLWRSFFTDRYERTSATRSLVDFRQIRALMSGMSEERPVVFDLSQHAMPTIEEVMAAGWPVRKDRLPRALLALSLRKGGFDFADGTPVSREHLVKREYHHLFPVAWLTQNGRKNPEIFRALNCGLVTWKTNRNISAKPPSQYLAERMQGHSLGEPEIRRRLESHLIPFDEIASDSYEEFLRARAETMLAAAQDLCDCDYGD
jgi:hypothetical protein